MRQTPIAAEARGSTTNALVEAVKVIQAGSAAPLV
jgi:hypothetical protein